MHLELASDNTVTVSMVLPMMGEYPLGAEIANLLERRANHVRFSDLAVSSIANNSGESMAVRQGSLARMSVGNSQTPKYLTRNLIVDDGLAHFSVVVYIDASTGSLHIHSNYQGDKTYHLFIVIGISVDDRVTNCHSDQVDEVPYVEFEMKVENGRGAVNLLALYGNKYPLARITDSLTGVLLEFATSPIRIAANIDFRVNALAGRETTVGITAAGDQLTTFTVDRETGTMSFDTDNLNEQFTWHLRAYLSITNLNERPS